MEQVYSKFKLAINKVGKYVMREIILDPTVKKQKCACGKNPSCLCNNKYGPTKTIVI